MLGGFYYFVGKIFFFTSYIGNNTSFPQPLSPEDEHKYLILYKEHGDEKAREILIKHNMRLVAHIVKKYTTAGEIDDLISVGSIGLIKAISTFKMDKQTHLVTFAARCIENEILMMIRSNKKFANNVSLLESIGTDKDGNELTLMDLLCVKEEGVFNQVENSILKEKFMAILKQKLTKREYIILVYRYGLLNQPVKTQKEVAKQLCISRSYVSRIEKRSLDKIREELLRTGIMNEE